MVYLSILNNVFQRVEVSDFDEVQFFYVNFKKNYHLFFLKKILFLFIFREEKGGRKGEKH